MGAGQSKSEPRSPPIFGVDQTSLLYKTSRLDAKGSGDIMKKENRDERTSTVLPRMSGKTPTVSPLTRSTLVILVLALGCLATALGGELVELREPTVVSFPNGYDVVDQQGRVLKSLPESRAATVKAYRQAEGTKLYVSDWSWERFQSAQRAPNYIRSRGGQATPIAPDGEDLRPAIEDSTSHGGPGS